MFSEEARRIVFSCVLAIPVVLAAMMVSVGTFLPDGLRYVISPGIMAAMDFAKTEPCGGLLDCWATSLGTIGWALDVEFAVDLVLYGFFIFGIATIISAYRKTSGPLGRGRAE